VNSRRTDSQGTAFIRQFCQIATCAKQVELSFGWIELQSKRSKGRATYDERRVRRDGTAATGRWSGIVCKQMILHRMC